jgi:hypothetical protein
MHGGARSKPDLSVCCVSLLRLANANASCLAPCICSAMQLAWPCRRAQWATCRHPVAVAGWFGRWLSGLRPPCSSLHALLCRSLSGGSAWACHWHKAECDAVALASWCNLLCAVYFSVRDGTVITFKATPADVLQGQHCNTASALPEQCTSARILWTRS